MKLLNEILDRRGDYVLHRYAVFDQFRWSTIEVVFNLSLLIWHIATDLIYYNDLDDVHGDYDALNSRVIIKCLSNYMFYLFVFHPSMLPEGIDERSYNDTSADAVRFFKPRLFHIKSAACKELLQEDFSVKQRKVNSRSVFFSGCRLAKQLQSFKNDRLKWEMIAKVWAEMLAYSANKCRYG